MTEAQRLLSSGRTAAQPPDAIEYLLQVIFKGHPYLIGSRDLTEVGAPLSQVQAVTAEQAESSMTALRLASVEFSLAQIKQITAAIAAGGRQGLTVLETDLEDTDEYNTGFNVSVLNSTAKTIKYVTFGVIGYNAVKDAVRLRHSGGTVVRFKGIGPVEPDDSASWSDVRLWLTNIVQTHRIAEIKVDYMDGTSKVIKDVGSVTLSAAAREMLLDRD